MYDIVPVRVEHSGGVATEQRYLVGKLAALVEGDDGEGTTTARLPVNGQVLGVGLGCERDKVSIRTMKAMGSVVSQCIVGRYLYEVGIPGIVTDAEVIIAELLARRLAEDVS